MSEREEQLKSLLKRVKEESGKSGLKLNIQKLSIMASGPFTSWRGNNGNSDRLYFLGLQNHCRWWLQSWNEKTLAIWKKSYEKPRQHIKKQRLPFASEDLYAQRYVFSNSFFPELDHKEGWTSKNWCIWTVVLKKTLESPLDCREIKPVHPKGNQPRIFIRRTDAEAEAPILWPTDAKSQLIEKDSDSGKDWGQEKRGWQRMKWLGGIFYSLDMNLSKLQEIVKDREAWHSSVLGVVKSWTQLSN